MLKYVHWHFYLAVSWKYKTIIVFIEFLEVYFNTVEVFSYTSKQILLKRVFKDGEITE